MRSLSTGEREPSHQVQRAEVIPESAPEWLAGSGVVALAVLLGRHLRHLGSGLRGALRWAGVWDRRIEAVEDVSELAPLLKEIAEQFKPNGGGLREAVNRIDARTESTETKVVALADDYRETKDRFERELKRIQFEAVQTAETIDRLANDQQDRERVAYDVLYRLAAREVEQGDAAS